MMHLDLLSYQLKLLLSLDRLDSLNENLVKVMFSTLAKLCNYCNAKVGVHIFTNGTIHELHTLLYGNSPISKGYYYRCLVQRNDLAELLDGCGLLTSESYENTPAPEYEKADFPVKSELFTLLDSERPLQISDPTNEARLLFAQLKAQKPDEFPEFFDIDAGSILTIPLGTGEYKRLGCFLLWIDNGSLFELNRQETERLTAFRKNMERLIIKVFTNFYNMEPVTYLPSYYQTDRKWVALLCTEIRGFDKLSEIINKRIGRDFTYEQAANCITRLINGFSKTVSSTVERYDGRIDQFWGSGILSLFGEYLVTPEKNPRIPCMKALSAAAELVANFRDIAKRWLDEDFKLEKFRESFSEYVLLDASVGVDYGEVMLDYVGSSRHRVYMALGEHVEFVKQLVRFTGYPQFKLQEQLYWFPKVLPLQEDDFLSEDGFRNNTPILISQTVHNWSRKMLIDLEGSPSGAVHRPIIINLKGMLTPYVVYQLAPGNISCTASE